MDVGREVKQILLVEDTVKNIQLLGTILRTAGYDVAVARDGEQAILDRWTRNT